MKKEQEMLKMNIVTSMVLWVYIMKKAKKECIICKSTYFDLSKKVVHICDDCVNSLKIINLDKIIK